MAGKKTVFVDSDILVIGGGFGGCGAAYESRCIGDAIKKWLLSRRLTLNEAEPLLKVFTPSTATWACVGEKTNLRIMFVIKEMTSWGLFVRT